MRNVYWLAKEKLPLSKIKSLCQLSALNGRWLGRHYTNEIIAREMLMSIAHVLRERMNSWARLSAALGLMIDESTDVSSSNSMVLYLRLFDARMQPTTMCWGLVEVHRCHFKPEVFLSHYSLHSSGV